MSVAVAPTMPGLTLGECSPLAAQAAPKPQSQRIREWAERAYKNRNAYGEKTAARVTEVLARAEKDVKALLLKYTTLGDLPEGKLANEWSLRRLQGEIRAVVAQVRDEHRLILGRAGTESFKRGLAHGIEEFAEAQLPFYRDLDETGIQKMATNIFTIVDTSALDFMTRFNIQLAGDVSRDLASGINQAVQTGIATGMSVRDIVKEMGTVVTDKEAFRHAGKKVFGKAQTRMELIARTETMRAHSQGQRKFYSTVGVRRLEWLTTGDERMCPECEALDGQVFLIDRFPPQPKHPRCRCGHVAVVDLPICGAGALAAHAAAEAPKCILSPDDVEAQATEVKADVAAVNEALKTGSFDALTVKQLQTAAKKQGISIARTKADFLKILDGIEPGVNHSHLTGLTLKSKLMYLKVGALRSKQELIDLLKAQYGAAAQQAVVEGIVPPAGGYGQFTVKQLQETAKGKGISLNMTKQDVIDLLDKVEPGVDHSAVSGPSLAAAKQKHGIGVLKNKQQLIDALNKHAGQQAAEQTKKDIAEAGHAAKVSQAAKDLVAKTNAVQVPDDPANYLEFLNSVKAAEDQIGASSILPKESVETFAKEVAVKKQVFQQKIQGMSSGEVKKLAQKVKIKHYQWASKGELATILTETDPAKVQAAVDSIEAKWSKSTGKPIKAKAPAPAPAPKPEPPAPAPAQPAVFAKKGSEFAEADTAWEQKGRPANFKLVGKADIEGAHTKYFYTDEKGEKWLFKPAAEEFRAHGDEVAYRIGRLIDPEAIEVRVITLDGRVGSIQKWKAGLASKADFAGVEPADLSPRDVQQLQREHVVDWLLSNHDGHGKQFLRAKDGHVYGIDKGQLFKFLGSDKLSIDYHPNGRFGESEPYYNTLFRAAKEGKVKFDPAATLRTIREVEKISDDDYRAILAPYAERRFSSKAQREAFYEAALERKRNIRKDFEGFYGGVLGQKDFRFEPAAAAPAKGARLGKAEVAILEEAKRAGWQGKVIPLDVEDIEDQNALVFVETVGGKPRTVVKMKIRPEAEAKMLKNLALTSGDKLTVGVGDALPQDTYYDTILGGVKTVNHHVAQGDQAYNQEKLAGIQKLVPELQKLAKSSDRDTAAMARQYLADAEKVLDCAKSHKKYAGQFGQYRKQFKDEPDRRKPVEDITARKTKVTVPLRELKDGQIRVLREGVSTGEVFGRPSLKAGVQYEIDLGDGITASYRPWVDSNYYAQQGEFELRFAGEPDPKRFEQVMERLDRMGIQATIATPQDAELLYLHKQAYVLKVDTSAEYAKVQRELDARSASKEERIARLRGFWEKRLGVPDVTKLPGYDPLGEHQGKWDDPKHRAGWRQQMRFDISDEDLEREMPGHAVYHRLTDDSSLPKFIDELLGTNGTMVSTVEKMRAGVKPGGMSPVEDMNTGGAGYFFTRIRKLPGQRGGADDPGLYFKKTLLRRMDAITYGGDKYGRVTGDTVRKNRRSDIADWKQLASRQGSDETIFKHSVTLLDNIEVVAARNSAQRTQVIEAFRKHGITRLPDGRHVEDIVVVP